MATLYGVLCDSNYINLIVFNIDICCSQLCFFFHFSAISEEEKSFMKQNLILSFDEPVNQVILKSTVKNIQIASDLPWHTFIYCRKYSSIVIQTRCASGLEFVLLR